MTARSKREKLKRLLMVPAKLVKTLFQQAMTQVSRSTVLSPLGWALLISGGGLPLSFSVNAPKWASVLFGIAFGLAFLLYLMSYSFCLAKDRDALRSEIFSIKKMAIEKGFVGIACLGFFMTSQPK
jgi:hypothetical protein